MRFTSSQTDIYADHLDWHYRQNRSEKDISRKVTHRRWYYSLTVSPKSILFSFVVKALCYTCQCVYYTGTILSPKRCLLELILLTKANWFFFFLGLDWIWRNRWSWGEGKESVLWKSAWGGCTEKPGSSKRERIPKCEGCCRCCSWGKHVC